MKPDTSIWVAGDKMMIRPLKGSPVTLQFSIQYMRFKENRWLWGQMKIFYFSFSNPHQRICDGADWGKWLAISKWIWQNEGLHGLAALEQVHHHLSICQTQQAPKAEGCASWNFLTAADCCGPIHTSTLSHNHTFTLLLHSFELCIILQADTKFTKHI